VTLSAETSDSDGSVQSLAWDLDDDGEFDDGSDSRVTWTFATAGPHRVALQATDDSGSATVALRELQVGGAAAPTASAGAPAARRFSLMRPFPVVRIAGRLTRRGAHLTVVSVRAPRGARITARCANGCKVKPFVGRAAGRRAKHVARFERSFRAGVRLVIRVSSSRRIGKYTRITIRRGRKPARVDRCLVPGTRAPQKCPG
jgi:hypothetical protein